jgi:hypothetical protein
VNEILPVFGRAQILKQDWRASIETLEQAVRLNPGDDAALRSLAEARRGAQSQ